MDDDNNMGKKGFSGLADLASEIGGNDEATSTKKPERPQKKTALSGRYRILIINFDEDMASMLKEWFKLSGHHIDVARMAIEILNQSPWRQYHCIISVIYQPGMNGLEFTKLVRKSGGPPVILMSGYQPQTDRLLALEAGAFSYVELPFDLQSIMDLIEECCEANQNPVSKAGAFRKHPSTKVR